MFLFVEVAPGKRSKRTNAYAPLRRSEEQRDVLDPEDDSQFYRVDDLEASDWRKCPQWEISYRQQVTPSDVFLQVGIIQICAFRFSILS